MPIKSLDELRKMMVGMATCGIAAGARETLTAILDEIESKGLKNIRVVQVGCMGYCHSEPTVQVNIPGQEPVLYGNVNPKVAKDIIEKHIGNGELLDENILIKTFDKA
jgi:NADP-reducing hydrogenase subunit HndB